VRHDELLGAWELRPDGDPLPGDDAVRLPVRTRSGLPALLKLSDPPVPDEHLALTRWDGDGAVRLLRADPRHGALLLEDLPGPDLSDRWDVEACEVVAGLYVRLHRPVGAPFTRLSEHLAGPLERLAALPRSASVPRRLVEQALALGRELVTDPDCDGVLVHTDLHYGCVRADVEGRWRAVDPRPLSGDPHYEVTPLLEHRFGELAGDVREGIRRRFHAVLDTAGLDEDRARAWVVVRTMIGALDGSAASRTRRVAVAKAVQD
jgi:streptomycin 6-kinase